MNDTKGKIAIIEDEEILVDVLTKKLETEGYRVISATDGEQGLRIIKNEKPDLILLDIVMPKLNGYEVLESLQKTLSKGEIPPIIIISNSGQPVEIDKAISLGAKDYIIKAQFTPEEVITKVNKFMGGANSVMSEPTVAPATMNDPAAVAGKPPEAKVLVVEDDQFLRDLLTTKLQKENFAVHTAIDGPGGVEKIIKEKPEVVLLDIILPGIDGFEILKKIRSHSDMDVKSIPIILLSNLGQEADIERGRALGANDYLIKSNFTIDEIIEKIRKTLAK